LTRRGFLTGALAGAAALRCGGAGRRDVDDAHPVTPAAAPTPAAGTEEPLVCVATEDNIEGPFFKAGAPHRAVLVDDSDPGKRLTVTGRVVDARCQPLAGAVIDVWQADASGAYDNRGFRFRGVMKTGDDGLYRLETIVPGRYRDGSLYRPSHIHVKLRATGVDTLTTQLYFEGDPQNGADPFIRESLIMALEESGDGALASSFDFVLG